MLEGGAPRFFRRLAEGVFDVEDLKRRTRELADFVAAARETYEIEKPIALGFSNGANIAAAILLTCPEVLAGALLIRTMLPFEPEKLPDLTGVPVLMLSGSQDPMAPARRTGSQACCARPASTVRHEIVPAGHGLAAEDLAIAEKWLSART